MTDVANEELELEPSTSEEVDEELDTEETEEIKLDRPAKNLVAEITRKNNAHMEQLMSQMTASFTEALQGLQSAPKPSEPVEQKTGFDAYTIDQLEQHAETLETTDPTRQKIERHVSDRKISDAVARQVGAFTSEQKLTNERREWAAKAIAKFPDLEDEKSEFYKKVQGELHRMDPKVVNIDPRAAYNAATAVAVDVGAPLTQRRTVPKPGATKGGARPVESPDGGSLTDAEITKVSESLKHALPKGKTFDKTRIRERAKHYTANLKHHLKG